MPRGGIAPSARAAGQFGQFPPGCGPEIRLDTVDRDRVPMSRNTVPVCIARRHGPRQFHSDMDGTFDWKNVPGGNYQLLGEPNRILLRDYFTKSVHFRGPRCGRLGFPVLPTDVLGRCNKRKRREHYGKVVDANGQPVANATVVRCSQREHRSRTGSLPARYHHASGNFSLRG